MKNYGMELLLVVSVTLVLAQKPASTADDFQLKNCYARLNSYGLESKVQSANQFLIGLLPNEQADQQVSKYVKQLSSAKYKDRESAEQQLISLGSRSLGVLAGAAEKGDPETKLRARRCLAVIEQSLPQMTSAAIQILQLDSDPSLSKQRRLQTLFQVAENLKSLEIEDDVQRAVIGIADKQCASPILSGIESTNGLIRQICIRALPKCCSNSKLRSFRGLLIAPNPEHALAAVESFGEIDPDLAVRQLVEVLIRSKPQQVRMNAIGLLRGLSNKYFGLDPMADPASQKESQTKWRQWRSANAPFDKDLFIAMKSTGELQPIGFLVSTNGQSLTYYAVNGEENWNLAVPIYDAQACTGSRYLVCERSANQVRLIDRAGRTLQSVKNVNSPADAEYLPNRNVLIAQGNGVVTEHEIAGNVVRRFEGLSTPFDVDRLRNGNTLVADSGNNRIVEFDGSGKIVWQKDGLAFPNNVLRLRDGRTLYSTYTSGKVGMLSAGGDSLWEKKVGDNSTLYSLHYAAGRIYVSDGRNKRICVLDNSGQLVREIPLKINGFCDVGFVTKANQ